MDDLELATDQPGTPTRVRRELSEAVTIADSDLYRAWPGRSTVADRLRRSLPPDEGAGRVRPQEEIVRTWKAKRRRRALADHGAEEVSCEEWSRIYP